MSHRSVRQVTLLCTLLLAILAVGACGHGPTAKVTEVTPGPTRNPTPTPVASDTAAPTDLLTPPPTANPNAACFGTATNKQFFKDAKGKLSFPVYCASALPSGWKVGPGTLWPGSRMTVAYEGPGSSALQLDEGAFCTTSPTACSPNTSDIGPVWLGDLAGELYQNSGALVIYVNPGTTHAYRLIGQSISQDSFKSIAAGFIRVP